MCQAAVGVISKALHEVDNAESILKIKNLIALFMQTMNVGSPTLPSLRFSTFNAFQDSANANHLLQTWNFPVVVFEDFLLRLFEKYAELLKRRFSDDFQEVWIHS